MLAHFYTSKHAQIQHLQAFFSLTSKPLRYKKMQHRIENLFYLCTGIALFFALNQHLIGHGVSYTCHAIEAHRNNFIFELGVLLVTGLTLFGAYSAWKTAPIFSVFAASMLIIGLGYLQNRAQFDDFNFAQAKVERVWGAK